MTNKFIQTNIFETVPGEDGATTWCARSEWGVAACWRTSRFDQEKFLSLCSQFNGLGSEKPSDPRLAEFVNSVKHYTRGDLQQSALATLAWSQCENLPSTNPEQVFKDLVKEQAKKQAGDEMLNALEDLGIDGDEPGGPGRGTGSQDCNRLEHSEALYRLAAQIDANGGMEFANLLGRAVEIAEGAAKEKALGSGMDSNITYGNDAVRAMPSELANDDTFFVRFAEGTLQQREQTTTTPKGRGPIITIVDQSGSMAGGPAVWARAMSFCMLRIAQLQGRPFHCVQFAGEAVEALSLEDASLATAADYLAVMTQWIDGGTCLEPALHLALGIVAEKGYEGSDFVCLSDGDWEEFHDEYEDDKPCVDSAILDGILDTNTGIVAINYLNDWHKDEKTRAEDIVRAAKAQAKAAGDRRVVRGLDHYLFQSDGPEGLDESFTKAVRIALDDSTGQ